MESCCVLGCDSYREAATKSIGYFKFPLHNTILVHKWLQQINRPRWIPSDHSQICSAHFNEEDLDYQRYRKHPLLKSNAIPMIFPSKAKKAVVKKAKLDQQIKKETAVDSKAIILEKQQNALPARDSGNGTQSDTKQRLRPNDIQSDTKQRLKPQSTVIKPSRTMRSTNKTEPTIQLIPVTQTRLQMMIPKSNSVLSPKSTSVSTEQPVSRPNFNSKKALLRITVHKEYHNVVSRTNEEHFETIYLPNHSEDEMDFETIKIENEYFQSECDNSNSRNHSETGNVLSNDLTTDELAVTNRQVPESQTKDSDIPEATFADVGDVIRDHVYSFPSALQLQYSYSKAQIDCDKFRKRLKTLRQQHKQEKEKVKKLQCHLADLGNKIKNNLYVDSVESKSIKNRRTKLGTCEDEYEKLLREVRKLKRSLVVDNTNIVETARYKNENEGVEGMVHEEEIEGSQETQNVKREVSQDDGEIIGEIEEDCGEIIGEIDENSIEIELRAETRLFDSTKEFLTPGLIEG